MVEMGFIARRVAAVLLVLATIGCAGPEAPDRELVAQGEPQLLARLGALEDNEQALPEAERLAVALLHVAPNAYEPQVQALNWLIVRARAAAGDVNVALLRFDATRARRALSGMEASSFGPTILGAGVGAAGAELSRALFLQQRGAEARRVAEQTLARACANRLCITSKRFAWLLALTGDTPTARIHLDLAIGEAVGQALRTPHVPAATLSTELQWSRQTQRVLSTFGATRDLDRTERAASLLLGGALRYRDPRYARFVSAAPVSDQFRRAAIWTLEAQETFVFLASAAPVEVLPLLAISELAPTGRGWPDRMEDSLRMRRGIPLTADIARIQDGQVSWMRTRAQREAASDQGTRMASPASSGSSVADAMAEHRLAILREWDPERRALELSIRDALNR